MARNNGMMVLLQYFHLFSMHVESLNELQKSRLRRMNRISMRSNQDRSQRRRELAKMISHFISFPFPEFSPVIRFFGGFPLHPFADPKKGF